MNLTLVRKDKRPDGIWGVLSTDAGEIAKTLEHSYSGISKIPDGQYACVRGDHRLHSMKVSFQTFEITGVYGHSNILFHSGNVNEDSDGCVLLGLSINQIDEKRWALTDSRIAFKQFMDRQEGVNEFSLTVKTLANG